MAEIGTQEEPKRTKTDDKGIIKQMESRKRQGQTPTKDVGNWLTVERDSRLAPGGDRPAWFREPPPNKRPGARIRYRGNKQKAAKANCCPKDK